MNTLLDLVSCLALVGAGFFAFVGGLGLVRFRDLPCRMHAATKASGAAFALGLFAVFLRVPGWETFAKGAIALAFAFLTLPVGAHLLARSALTNRTDAAPDADGETATRTD